MASIPSGSDPASSAPMLTRSFQESERTLQNDHPNRHVYRHWRLEGLTFLLATSLQIGIIVLLISADGLNITDWPLQIDINTLIALLSTILRTCLVIVIEEILSQSKWLWFRCKPRPLYHLQTYDEASRGLVGSFKLLAAIAGGIKGDILAAIAALVMILSLSIGPFSQQATGTVECTALRESNATIKVANFIPPLTIRSYQDNDIESMFNPWPEAEVKGLITSAIAATTAQDNTTLFSCPTNECHFSATATDSSVYSTAGFCNTCFDSKKVGHYKPPTDELPLRDWVVTISNVKLDLTVGHTGQFTQMSSNHSSLEFARSILSPEYLNLARYSILNATKITRSDELCDEACTKDVSQGKPPKGLVSAATCILYPCIKHLRSRVKGNSLIEEIISTNPVKAPTVYSNPGSDDLNSFLYGLLSPCYINSQKHVFKDFDAFGQYQNWNMSVPFPSGSELNSSPYTNNFTYLNQTDAGACFFGFSLAYLANLRQWLEEEFIADACGSFYSRSPIQGVGCEKWWLDSLWLDEKNYRPSKEANSFDHLQRKFDDLAIALTNYFRTIERSTASFSNLPRQISGSSQEQAQCIKFNWPWILWPCLLYLVTGIGLVRITSRGKTYEQATWKSSILPLLLFGLERGPESVGTENQAIVETLTTEDVKGMEKMSKKIIVRLKQSNSTKRSAFVEEAASDDIEGSISRTSALQEDNGLTRDRAIPWAAGDED